MRIILPENISDIKLGTFQKYHELTTRTDLTEFQFNKRKIEIFTGLKQSDIRKIKRSDYEEINAQIDKALNEIVDFKPTFFIKDVEFGFIPNLDDISAGEYIDLSKYGVDVATMHNLMAVLFRPISKKDSFGNYEIIEYEGTKQYADIMKHMPMDIVNGALVFFSSLANELTSYTQRFMEEEQMKANRRVNTLKSGGGMQPLKNWLRVKFGKWKLSSE
jgi:hypothetical protein